jgi:hypothetical protein
MPVMSMVLGVVGLLPASGAHADTTTALKITSFYQIVADTAHSHLFISQGSSSQNHIIVTNLAGKQVATIGGQDGVMGIALSPDGKTLYAALSALHAVTAISTSTLKETASYSIGNTNTPHDVAVQSGKVWVSYDTGTPSMAAIGDIDLTTNTPAFETQAAMGGWYSAPELAADPHDTGVLVAAQPGISPASAGTYDTSAEPATVRAPITSLSNNCDNQRDLAVVPGGSQFILACGAPYAHFRYSTADLSQQGSYASTNYPASVAIDARGDVAAGTANNPYAADLYIYHQNGDKALNTYNLASSSTSITLMPRGLAWAADGSRLFAVINDFSANTYSLRVIDGPTLIQPRLSLATGSKTFSYNSAVHVTAHLGKTATNRTVSIYAQRLGGTTRKLLKTGRVNSSGNLTVSYKAPYSTTFTVAFSGDGKYAPATATSTVYVRAAVSESLTGYYSSEQVGGVTYWLFHRHSVMHVHVHVRPNKDGQCVKFELQIHYQGAWHGKITRCAALDSSSRINLNVNLGRAGLGYHYRIRADYVRSKDTSNLSNDSAWQFFIVKR